MVLPPGKTEKEVLAAIELIVSELAANFAFGYYSVEDIEQEIRFECLKALAKYDNLRPLENFFYIVARSRLYNLKRNKLTRTDAPCKLCHNNNFCNDGRPCQKYIVWKKRNDTKASSMRPTNIEDHDFATDELPADEKAEQAEIFARIDEALPVELRATYLQMKEGVKVPYDKREEVLIFIRELLGA